VHYNFSKGIADWVARHNRYSTDEANRICREPLDLRTSLWEALFGQSAEDRQQARKRCSDLLPCRPLVRFVYLYFWRWGFLDGMAGLHYCLLMSVYDFLTGLKVRERRA
jgi:hypothetical protein